MEDGKFSPSTFSATSHSSIFDFTESPGSTRFHVVNVRHLGITAERSSAGFVLRNLQLSKTKTSQLLDSLLLSRSVWISLLSRQ